MSANSSLLRISVSLPVRGTYSYAVPPALVHRAKVGCRVLVPFNNRRVTGYILEKITPRVEQDLKEILEVLDPVPLFTEAMVPFFEWLADYYASPLGQVIRCALPGGLNTRSYKTAELTDRGVEALENLPSDSEEARILSWVREHPGRRLIFSLRDVSALEKMGLLSLESRERKGGARPLLRRFVRAREGIDMDALLGNGGVGCRAENEQEFLSSIIRDGPLPLGELSARFSNGAYLIGKWVKKGVLEKIDAGVQRKALGEILRSPPPPKRLLGQQLVALERIQAALDKRTYSPFLLHGVTGSGKTEVYIRAVQHAVNGGRKAIVMVPEIALVTYMEGLFRSRLDGVTVYHSGLSEGERYDQWMRMARGKIDLVVGARSALFSPLPDLGLIIVDEEHDPAYKQEGNPRYQARDAAVLRAKLEGAVVVLGSGTPSIQSFHNCLQERYSLLSMPDRVEKRPLPVVEVVDMKAAADENGTETRIIGRRLKEELNENLAARNQAILFLNRRGYHRLYLCRSCGEALRCRYCDVSLTHHLQENRLVCHYCGFQTRLGEKCLKCGCADLRAYGFGTEKLEDELKAAFPDARIARLDTDSTRRKGQAFSILKGFSDHDIDILVGTQMITKGYDFPNVTLVGVVAADLSLNFPDFRASERTFQLIAQVAGRAGRGRRPGKVVIQTFNPSHSAISAAALHNYRSFFEQELNLRQQLRYPPFSYLAALKVGGKNEEETGKAARRLASDIRTILSGWAEKGNCVQVLGPVEAAIYRLKGKYRWQILIKSRRASLMTLLLRRVDADLKESLKSRGVQVTVDVDPYQMG